MFKTKLVFSHHLAKLTTPKFFFHKVLIFSGLVRVVLVGLVCHAERASLEEDILPTLLELALTSRMTRSSATKLCYGLGSAHDHKGLENTTPHSTESG